MSKIDVSWCEYYFCGECRNDRTEFECCTKNDNCYYKQLQQLKAENEELKKQVRFKNQFRDYAHKYKNALDEIEEIVKEKCDNCTIDDYSYCPECRYTTIRDIRKKIKETKEGDE